MHSPVVTVGGVSNAAVQGVAHDGATTEIWNVNPQIVVAPRLNSLVKGVERHTWLNQTRAIIRIDVEDFVHSSTEVDNDGSPDSWSGAPISHCNQMIGLASPLCALGSRVKITVSTHRDGIDGNAIFVGPQDDGLDFCCAAGVGEGRCDSLFGFEQVKGVVGVGVCGLVLGNMSKDDGACAFVS